MVIHHLNFPNSIKTRVLRDIRKNKLDITFNSGAIIMFENSNIKVTKSHNIVFHDNKKYIIAYIVENDIDNTIKPNIYINSISSETKVSLTSLIELVNQQFFPTSINRS